MVNEILISLKYVCMQKRTRHENDTNLNIRLAWWNIVHILILGDIS